VSIIAQLHLTAEIHSRLNSFKLTAAFQTTPIMGFRLLARPARMEISNGDQSAGICDPSARCVGTTARILTNPGGIKRQTLCGKTLYVYVPFVFFPSIG
jgi:hypothetical protein